MTHGINTHLIMLAVLAAWVLVLVAPFWRGLRRLEKRLVAFEHDQAEIGEQGLEAYQALNRRLINLEILIAQQVYAGPLPGPTPAGRPRPPAPDGPEAPPMSMFD